MPGTPPTRPRPLGAGAPPPRPSTRPISPAPPPTDSTADQPPGGPSNTGDWPPGGPVVAEREPKLGSTMRAEGQSEVSC